MRACKLVACTKGEKAVEKWQYQLDFPPPPATEAVPHRYGSRSPLLPDRHGGIRVALTDLEPSSSVRRGRRPSRRISAHPVRPLAEQGSRSGRPSSLPGTMQAETKEGCKGIAMATVNSSECLTLYRFRAGLDGSFHALRLPSPQRTRLLGSGRRRIVASRGRRDVFVFVSR